MKEHKINWSIVSNALGAMLVLLATWANVSLSDISRTIQSMDKRIDLNAKDTFYLRKDLDEHKTTLEAHKK